VVNLLADNEVDDVLHGIQNLGRRPIRTPNRRHEYPPGWALAFFIGLAVADFDPGRDFHLLNNSATVWRETNRRLSSNTLKSASVASAPSIDLGSE